MTDTKINEAAVLTWIIENETTVRTTDCPNVAERYRVRGYHVSETEGENHE